ncbi:Nucleoside diphosphate kinase protein 5 [Fasciola gigantica]|uniref:Nucleoside diphosphate kinase protein 5 n=1 Tax=Fasciola gigantica TaxID=46835 RepID=A0A504Y9H4_FASGI|nr:Nucleoside diphosphate kinase protein 5 [Fasciola gigantica]
METDSIPHIHVERTLAIIKPDAVSCADEIEEIILKNGFFILQPWLADWLLENNPNRPSISDRYMVQKHL